MIDARLNFKDQVEHASCKAATVGGALSRLMTRRRALLASVITSILTYGIAIWSSALQLQECQRRIYPVGRKMALRVASAFRTVSRDAAHVISGLLPIEILAEEQRRIYQHKSQGSQMQMSVGKEKDRKVFNAGRHSGTAPKRADGSISLFHI